MQEPSIFTRIINDELPSYKICEDEHSVAFLDLHPARPGHTLVVSKKQIDRLEDLPQDEYDALMTTVKKVMRHIAVVFGPQYRPCLKTEGFDIPHVHVHIIPCKTAADFWAKQRMDIEPDHAALKAMAEKLRF